MPRPIALAALVAALLVPCATPAATADTSLAAERIVEATNAFRRESDLGALALEAKLAAAARDFVQFMARTGKFAHDADGRTPPQRARRHGYDYCMVAENIGYLFRTRGFTADELARGLVEGWKRSSGHRKNLLDREATETAVAVARAKDGRYYAVQLFGRPASLSVTFTVANESRTSAATYRVGGTTHTLSPLTERTHEVCSAEPVTLGGRTVRPRGGERLLVR